MGVEAIPMIVRAVVISACILALWPSDAAAQRVGFGFKGGVTFGDIPNITNEFDGDGVDPQMRVGAAGGVFLTVDFGSGFMLQPEVLYTQKGVKLAFEESGLDGTIRIKVDYLEIPVLARLTFGKGLRGYVFGGPSINFNMCATGETGFLGETEEEDISDEVESLEFAVVFGGGIEIGPVLFEGRWSEGLTDIAKVTGDEPAPNLKTRTFMVLFGLRF
jgi:hypothetical protein